MLKQWEARERKTLNAGSRIDLGKIATESNWTYATVRGTVTPRFLLYALSISSGFLGDCRFSGKRAILGY